mmetsp:Transcript_33538/g.81058  ORF Transcript_33538/g.81058 Transcript_33538/m.81058 type:complete len:219 (-) Transcript_33538:561-1217(-)
MGKRRRLKSTSTVSTKQPCTAPVPPTDLPLLRSSASLNRWSPPRNRQRFGGSSQAPCAPSYTARSSSSRVRRVPNLLAIPMMDNFDRSARRGTGSCCCIAGRPGSYCSKRACALVPPKPKAESPERLGHSAAVAGQLTGSVTTAGLIAFVTLGVGGMTPCSMDIKILVIPANPAATKVWPKLPFVEPTNGILPPKHSFTASSSTGSPTGVPVAWHSTY